MYTHVEWHILLLIKHNYVPVSVNLNWWVDGNYAMERTETIVLWRDEIDDTSTTYVYN